MARSGYVEVPRAVLDNAGGLGLKFADLGVLQFLDSYRYTDPEKLVYEPYERIADAFGCDVKTVESAIRRLEAGGFIERRGYNAERGRWGPVLWSLTGYDAKLADLIRPPKAVDGDADHPPKAVDGSPPKAVVGSPPKTVDGPPPKAVDTVTTVPNHLPDHLRRGDEDDDDDPVGEKGNSNSSGEGEEAPAYVVDWAEVIDALPERHRNPSRFHKIVEALRDAREAHPDAEPSTHLEVAEAIAAYPHPDPLLVALDTKAYALGPKGRAKGCYHLAGLYRSFLKKAPESKERREAARSLAGPSAKPTGSEAR
jgi:DNA-binding Lrp family transcriptional regulator